MVSARTTLIDGMPAGIYQRDLFSTILRCMPKEERMFAT
jgi:hypothetical protein